MKFLFSPLFLIIFFIHPLTAQEPIILKGTVKEAKTQEVLTGVAIRIKGTTEGAITDAKGTFTISTTHNLPLELEFSMVGYKNEKLRVEQEKQSITVHLQELEEELQAVVISASRSPETIDETPSSVTILPEKVLRESMIISTNLSDILSNQLPGLAPSTATSSNWGQTLRGRSLLIMIDGVPQSTPLRNGGVDMRALDPAVIERVEVLKGATAVYGNGAAGGLINYITKTPRTADAFSSETSIGMGGSLVDFDNSIGARFSQQFWGKTGKLDYVVSGVYEQTGEWKDAEGDVLPPTYGLGETDSYNAFVKLGLAWLPGHRIQASYNFYSSEQKTRYLSDFGNYAERRKTKAVLGEPLGVPQGVRANHNFNLLFSGKDLPFQTTYDIDAYYQSVDNVFFWSDAFVGGGQSRILSNKKGLRFVFNTPILEGRNISSGITYGLDLLNDVTSQPLVDGRLWVPEMDMNSLAPFAQVRLSLWQHLVIKGGFRMERLAIGVEDYTTLDALNTTSGEVVPGFNVRGGELNYNAYLVNAGLRFNKWELFTPYASFSQGFSVADIGVMLRSARVDDISKINTEAIIINNYEAGFVSKWKNLRFEGVGYISTSELGTSGRFVDGIYEVMRSPEKIWGFEAIADVQILKNLTAGGSYSWVEGKMDNNDNNSYRDEADAYLGGERISAPKLTGYINYSLLKDQLNLQLQYTGVQERSRFERNEAGSYNVYQAPVEAYRLFNFSAAYQMSKSTRLALGIENLLNEDYFPARSQWFTQPSLYNKGRGAAFNLTATITL